MKAKKKNQRKRKQPSINQKFFKFKKMVEKKLGKINWAKVGVYGIALLLFVATKGILGVKAKIIAVEITKFMATTQV